MSECPNCNHTPLVHGPSGCWFRMSDANPCPCRWVPGAIRADNNYSVKLDQDSE